MLCSRYAPPENSKEQSTGIKSRTMNQTSKRVVEALSKLNEASKEVQAALQSEDVLGGVISPQMVVELYRTMNQTLIAETPILTAYAVAEGIELPETDSRLESTE